MCKGEFDMTQTEREVRRLHREGKTGLDISFILELPIQRVYQIIDDLRLYERS